MSREKNRERSELRRQEFRRTKRWQRIAFTVGLLLTVVLPVLWNGAIQYGLIHPIDNPQFASSLQYAWAIASFATTMLAWRVFIPTREPPKQRQKYAEKGVPIHPI